MFVRTWMSSPVRTVEPYVPVQIALEFMNRHGIRRLPVLHNERLVGIVAKSDLLAVVGRDHPNRRGEGKAVEDVMKRDPITVPPDETVEGAARLMLLRKISSLPVVEDESLVGIITESDVFRAVGEMMGVQEQGARFMFSVPDEDDLLSAIFRHLKGLSLRSLATFHDPQRRQWDVVVRVRGKTAGVDACRDIRADEVEK
ncbi:MAG: CBS domain-containing protein [Planctomycetes bacterium]|nr:CBS domain-containing protein [Planctomycetota bacterium]